jgi:hypothetical protein
MIEIPVAIALLDYDGIAAITVITLADHFAIAFPIAITMATADGHADRADAHANFFCTSGHRKTDCGRRNSHHCKTLNHFLSSSICERSERQFWLT